MGSHCCASGQSKRPQWKLDTWLGFAGRVRVRVRVRVRASVSVSVRVSVRFRVRVRVRVSYHLGAKFVLPPVDVKALVARLS